MTPEEYRVDRDELISETIAGASGNNAIRTELWAGDLRRMLLSTCFELTRVVGGGSIWHDLVSLGRCSSSERPLPVRLEDHHPALEACH